MTPLEDLDYDPKHKPEHGRVPEIVGRWGPKSQLRWFERFRRDLYGSQAVRLYDFYCESVEHKGYCCGSCMSEEYDGDKPYDDYCCCEGYKAAKEASA